jgi:murein DD-endopeptidase MepM/ murein hydrolase activator NlpD
LATPFNLWSQSKESLEKERMKIIEQIEKTSRMLDKTSKDKKATLTDLKLLQGQIENRHRVITNIRNSLEIIEKQLASENKRQNQLVIRYLELKKDHASLLKMSYNKMLTENKLVYLLSSRDWEESLNRLRYTAMIEDYLSEQINKLNFTAKEIKNTIDTIESSRLQYEELLASEEQNIRKLELDEKTKDRMLAQLKGDEKRLKGALIQQKKDREELNRAIEKIILATLNKNKTADDPAGSDGFNLAGAFEGQRGKLPWPVVNPRVISKYGKQKHPTLDNVFISNNGIDVFSEKNANVRAIFKGEVAGALQIPGNDYMVMIKHGNFYTVYSKMSEVFVSKGDRIDAGHQIGKLGINNATLHFEVWKDKQKLNPESWLR